MNITINIPENATNGDVIKDMLNPYKICEDECLIKVYLREDTEWFRRDEERAESEDEE